MNNIDFGSVDLMPVIADQHRARTDSQEEEEEHATDHSAHDDGCDHNADEGRDEESSDHVVCSNGKRHAEKGKAPANQSSTESRDSILGEVTSTLYLSDNLTTPSQC